MEKSTATKSGITDKTLPIGKTILVSTLFVAVILGILVAFDTQTYVEQLFAWLDKLGFWAPVLFILIDTVIVVLLLPGVIFTFGAGFLFGVIKGSLYIITATTIGGILAFIVARYLFSDRLSGFLLTHPQLESINREFECRGWKIILLTRLVPFFPFKLSNYFFGLTRFTLRDFVIGTAIGIIPITVTNVYLGSLAADLTSLMSGTSVRSPVSWVVYGLGLITAIFAVVYFTRLAKKGLEPYLSGNSS